MEFDILEQGKNDLLEREELKIQVKHKGAPTPKKLDVLTSVCAKKNFDTAKTLIKDFVTIFGTNTSEGWVYAYESAEAMNASESKEAILKGCVEKAKPKVEETSAEGAKAEEKSKEKKEEPKVEEKSEAKKEKKEAETK